MSRIPQTTESTRIAGFPPAAHPLDRVRHALEDGRAMLAFQPVMHAARPDTPAFHEGLIRLVDTDGRMIPVASFIDMAEDTETGRMIDCKALELGLQALRADPGLRLSVNISARTIGHRPWLQVLEQGLARDITAAERLIVEITERSAITAPRLVVLFMAALRERGISFALDDFGAGNTSFRHLRQFRFDIVKIDGSFTGGIPHDADNQALIRAMIGLARHFEMMVVCEAVETAEEAGWLTSAGVDALQGYHLGRPALSPLLPGPEPSKRAG